MKLDKRIEEAVPAGQQLQELGMRLRCLDDGSSDQVSFVEFIKYFILLEQIEPAFD
jgi:homeobox protein HoxA/B/C/D4